MIKYLFVAFFLSTLIYAQDIKLKKEIILNDKTEIAKLESPFRDNYVFSDLKGNKQFTVEFKSLSENGTDFYQWLLIKNADETKTTEIEYEVLKTSFNVKKIILELLAQKYKLIDGKGINKENLNSFFNIEREKLSEKYTKIVAEATQQKAFLLENRAKIVAKYKPTVTRDYKIIFNGNSTQYVGTVSAKEWQFGGNNPIQLYDLDRVKVADVYIKSPIDPIKVTTYDGKTFSYSTKNGYTPDDFSFLTYLVEELVSRDYIFGHQAKTNENKIYQAKVEVAKEKTANIYNQKGYVIDQKGTKYNGTININFQLIDVNETGQTSYENKIDKFGKEVKITYLNEKGKERISSFNASDNTKFCVYTNNKEECYYGTKVSGDALKKLENAASLGFNNAYFYKILYELNGHKLLQDPVETDRLVILLKDEKSGQMLDKRNNENLSKALSKYLDKCPNLSKEINQGVFDLKIIDNLITIIEEFNECK